jgi:hypothetical protein
VSSHQPCVNPSPEGFGEAHGKPRGEQRKGGKDQVDALLFGGQPFPGAGADPERVLDEGHAPREACLEEPGEGMKVEAGCFLPKRVLLGFGGGTQMEGWMILRQGKQSLGIRRIAPLSQGPGQRFHRPGVVLQGKFPTAKVLSLLRRETPSEKFSKGHASHMPNSHFDSQEGPCMLLGALLPQLDLISAEPREVRVI